MNGSPLSKKKTVQLMVILTILAWATQTLFHQWGYGAAPELEQSSAGMEPDQIPAEKFVPSVGRSSAAGTLELRVEATVYGPEVKLRQIARWSGADEGLFGPIGDLVLARLGERKPYRTITVEDLRKILADAGVNLGVIRFAGATACTVRRSDVTYDDRAALEEWAGIRRPEATVAESRPVEAQQATDQTNQTAPAEAVESGSPVRSLRDILLQDIAARVHLPVESLQVTFNPDDEKLLNLSEPAFRFSAISRKSRSLGNVAWDVTVANDKGSQKVTINALARAWQDQVVVARPIGHKQIIGDADVSDRRVLVDRLDDNRPLNRAQVVGQQAAMARLVEPVQMAQTGQLITVTLSEGNIEIKTVARAMDDGALGQTIRVRNETTREVYEVILTGPQTARMGPGRTTPGNVASAE
jgi:flagella basal body P-ring formation protein FlgA